MKSICNYHHGVADDLFADPEAGLEHFADDALTEVLVILVHDGVVVDRIKGLAHFTECLDAETFHNGHQTGHGHFHALLVGFIGGFLGQCPLQVVKYRQELANGLGLNVGVQRFALFLGPLTEVVIFGNQTQVIVVLGHQLGFQLFRYNIEMLKFCLCFRLSRKFLEYILAFFEGKRNNIFAQKC